MALPSEYGVSLAIRSSGFCRRYAASSRSSSGKARSRSLFASAQVGLLTLRERGRTTLQNQQCACYESNEYEKALHFSCAVPSAVSATRLRGSLLRKLSSRLAASKSWKVLSPSVDRFPLPGKRSRRMEQRVQSIAC